MSHNTQRASDFLKNRTNKNEQLNTRHYFMVKSFLHVLASCQQHRASNLQRHDSAALIYLRLHPLTGTKWERRFDETVFKRNAMPNRNLKFVIPNKDFHQYLCKNAVKRQTVRAESALQQECSTTK